MPVELNHTIVASHDKHAAASWFTELFGRGAPKAFGPFLVVEVDNGVSLDFMDVDDAEIVSQHYAFLVGEDDFDAIFGRVQAGEVPYWADPGQQHPQQINTHDGGRGVYFASPDGHWLEIITRPYGSGG